MRSDKRGAKALLFLCGERKSLLCGERKYFLLYESGYEGLRKQIDI